MHDMLHLLLRIRVFRPDFKDVRSEADKGGTYRRREFAAQQVEEVSQPRASPAHTD